MRTAQLLRYIRPISFNTLKAGRQGEKNAPILEEKKRKVSNTHTHRATGVKAYIKEITSSGSWFHFITFIVE